ncbi:hypothetical protein TanjilG_12538 [Lupinus angustifolius]|uniref:Uncharacterized protein n=2 Tax=Lupinus angustifolius TaxID=3871 RepID=A0A4P1QYL3_LUPAN|nr:hypothetical protein TanjilG_12538 [Lupinus angustifolius]
MQYLERRECEYDQKTLVSFYNEEDSLNPVLTGVIVFTSTADKANKYYLGPAPVEDMARQIATAHGPFGNNRDYLLLLEKAMSDIGHEDDYVIVLANEVRKELGMVNVAPKDKNLVAPAKLQHSTHVVKSLAKNLLRTFLLPSWCWVAVFLLVYELGQGMIEVANDLTERVEL